MECAIIAGNIRYYNIKGDGADQTLRLPPEKDDYYAKMVREGLMTREEALIRLKKENILPLDETKALLNEAGIKES